MDQGGKSGLSELMTDGEGSYSRQLWSEIEAYVANREQAQSETDAGACRDIDCICDDMPLIEAEKPTKGTFLDETIGLRDPEGETLTSAVMDVVAARREPGRQRKPADIDNERKLLRCMIANGLLCEWHRKPPVVSYLRRAAGYSGKPNKPIWLSGRALSREADLRAAAGLIRLLPGERETASGYIISGELLDLAHHHGVSIQSLQRSIDSEDLVRLKAERPKATFDVFMRKLVRHKGERIYFEPTTQTEEWRDAVGAYNDFLSQQDIKVEVSADIVHLWTTALNEDEVHSGGKIYRPELFRKAVYRVFNDGTADHPTFERGGRLAGGFWMNVPKEVRPYITIGGQPTIELDYGACHPRMLYHERGLDCIDDPYDIPEVVELGQAAGATHEECRSWVKWIFQFLINGRRRPGRNNCPPDVKLPPDIKPSELAKIIEARHESIADDFRTGAGLRLMRLESDIAMAVITKAREQGWLALPIHDSFVTAIENKTHLRKMMTDEYIKKFHREPRIK